VEDISVILLGVLAAGAGVFLAREQGAPSAATPTALVAGPGGVSPSRVAPPTGRVYSDQRPRHTGSPYFPISANPVTNVLREIGHASNYPFMQRAEAMNRAQRHMDELYAARPDLFCEGPEGGHGLVGFG